MFRIHFSSSIPKGSATLPFMPSSTNLQPLRDQAAVKSTSQGKAIHANIGLHDITYFSSLLQEGSASYYDADDPLKSGVELQISEAIEMKIQVQRRLHQQLEVQRHLQLLRMNHILAVRFVSYYLSSCYIFVEFVNRVKLLYGALAELCTGEGKRIWEEAVDMYACQCIRGIKVIFVTQMLRYVDGSLPLEAISHAGRRVTALKRHGLDVSLESSDFANLCYRGSTFTRS
ncbi:Myb-related protein 2-like protein isoform X2 [Tanacetum coccineum]